MNKRHVPWLAVSTVLALGSASNAVATGLLCEPASLTFRTTQWLNPFDFNQSLTDASGVVTVTPVATTLGSDKAPITVVLPESGGVISRTLQVAPGFDIKKVLICAQTHSVPSLPIVAPVANLTVTLSQTQPTASSRTLSFDRMVPAASPYCAVYRVDDDLGSPAHAVDPSVSPTTLSITIPAATGADLSAIGLRLQAVAGSPLWNFVPYHQHAYRTGRGVGHNNTVALTSTPTNCLDEATVFDDDTNDLVDFTPELPNVESPPAGNGGGKGKGKGKGKNK
ncbi:MAG: hypothetical protein FIA97_15630 [Methylococcaceae bacterium]|nr:hypothetical protein [Methylococcaceae bacterium]